MSKERYKLHWITAIIEMLKTIKEALLPLIVIIVANGWRGDDQKSGLWYIDYLSFIILGVVIIFLLVAGIVKWRRFEYWFEDDELRIEYGLFVRKKRYIPFERIQSLDYTESIFHRPFRLVKVKVETAGTSSLNQAEGELTAITKEQATIIEKEIAYAKQQRAFRTTVGEDTAERTLEPSQSEDPQPVITEQKIKKTVFQMSSKDLFILATTSGGMGVILSGVAIFFSQFSDFIPYEKVFDEISSFIRFGVFVVTLTVLMGLIVVWLLSVAWTFISYYGFTVTLEDDDLIISRGLLEKKRVTVPLKRVQCVNIIENPLRQPFRYANVVIHSAGGGVGDGSKINIFPLVKKNRCETLLKEVFPTLNLNEPTQKIPARGKRFFYRIDFLWMIPVIVAVSYFFFPFGLFSILIIPLIIAFGLWQYKTAAYTVHDKQLTMRFRQFSRQTAYIVRRRIQSLEMSQSYFHRRKKVASIHVYVKSGIGAFKATMPFMDESEAERMLEWFEKKVDVKHPKAESGSLQSPDSLSEEQPPIDTQGE